MATTKTILAELKKLSDPRTLKTYLNHGAPVGKTYGVKVGDMKPIAKKIKGEQQLGLDLYDTGIQDAMYLAGLIVDGSQMTKTQLNAWVKKARDYCGLATCTVTWVAAEHPDAIAIANKWIKAKDETTASTGWCVYAGSLSILPDEQLDFVEIKAHLDHIVKNIHAAPNGVRYTMNGFVISTGAYVKPLLKNAKAAAKKIGHVEFDAGNTSCKLPDAIPYIQKIEDMGRVGKKRKTLKC